MLRLSMCCAAMLCGSVLWSGSVTPDRATTQVPEVPIAALHSSFSPKGGIWVRAKIIQQTDEDTYIVQDRTGMITLFLPTENLLALHLTPGMDIVIYGTVDVSSVTPEKNEFYAERILLPARQPACD